MDVLYLPIGGHGCPKVSAGLACRHSYVEGRLRLAEKERQRLVKGKTGPPAAAVVVGPSDEELQQLKAIADANMAALLEEEEVKKVRSLTDLLPVPSDRAIRAYNPYP